MVFMGRPLILLSNDDGYRAEGIGALRDALQTWADVVVCAPNNEQSASSHSLSLHRPLRVKNHEPGVYAVDGTPADSVYLALHGGLLKRPPDLVVSGMNHGLNLGVDVFYSGTVAAAREGALQGFLALAVSAANGADRPVAAARASEVAQALWSCGLGGNGLFNLNLPAGTTPTTAVRATRLGRRLYGGGLVRRQDPRGQDYYWIGGSDREVSHGDAPGSDTEAYDQGIIGLTPLVLDLWSSHLEDDARLVVEELAIAASGAVE